MRCVPQQETALGEALANEAEVMLLQVTQATVHHLGRLGGRAGRKVAPFHSAVRSPLEAGVERNAGPGDPSPHDDDVEALVCQPGQSDVTVEHGRWSSHHGTVSTACHKPTTGPDRLAVRRQLPAPLARLTAASISRSCTGFFVREPICLLRRRP